VMLTMIDLSVDLLATAKLGQAAGATTGGGAAWSAAHGVAKHPKAASEMIRGLIAIPYVRFGAAIAQVCGLPRGLAARNDDS